MRSALLAVALLLAALPYRAQSRDLDFAVANAPYSEALDFVDRLAAGDFYGAIDCLSENFRKSMTSQRLSERWKSATDSLGRLQSREVKSVSPDGTTWHITVLCEFQKGRANVVVDIDTLTTDRKVRAFRVVPVADGSPVAY